jgi:hypothetical protein
MELRQGLKIASALVDGPGFPNTGMGDQEHVEVRVEWPRGFDPDFLFKCRGDD